MVINRFDISIEKKLLPFKEDIEVDADKSMSIRSFLIGSICNGISFTKNVLESDDVLSAIKCLKKLGVKILKKESGNYKIYGNGLGSLIIKRNNSLNFGNSGTLARLLIGILTTTPNIQIKLGGDHSLNKRNMKELINLMSEFGANFFPKKKFTFPLKIESAKMPIGIKYFAGSSAQLKSAVIFAALNSSGNTKIFELERSRNHTENMLMKNSQAIKIKDKINNKSIAIKGKQYLNPINIDVPGDPSSAAFFTALTLLNNNSKLRIKSVGLNPTRIGFYKLLKRHGAKIKLKNFKKINNEIRGDIHVESCKIKPIRASKEYYVNSTDEYPILFVIASLTKGISVFKGIKGLANKESNRIKEMQNIFKQIGIKTVAKGDSLKIFGKEKFNANHKKIYVPNLGDHRICMSSFVLAVITGTKAKIKNFETVNTSSPSFLKIIKSLGAKYEIQK